MGSIIEPVTFGGITAIIVTIIMKIVEYWLKRGERALDEAGSIRKELREQNDELNGRIGTLTKRLDELSADLDAWKGKYYGLLEQYTTLCGEKTDLERRLKVTETEVIELQKEVSALRAVALAVEDGLKSRGDT